MAEEKTIIEEAEPPTAYDYIATAYNALCAVDGLDAYEYTQEIKEIQNMAIEIIYNQMKIIHSQVFKTRKKRQQPPKDDA